MIEEIQKEILNLENFNAEPLGSNEYGHKEFNLICKEMVLEILDKYNNQEKNLKSINDKQHARILQQEQEKEELIKWLENDNERVYENERYSESYKDGYAKCCTEILSKLKGDEKE